MVRTVVGILRGGSSSEYALSLKTGAALIAALPEERYEVRDIFIDKQGMWHLYGSPSTPARALSQVDAVLNALHGGIGEDGTVQRLLERMHVPYAGARAHASALALHKVRARTALAQVGIRIPQAVAFTADSGMDTGQMAYAVFGKFAAPYVVKPPTEGASVGIRYAATIRELPDALAEVLVAYGMALVEEYVRGREATVGIIEQFRKQPLYALPPAEVSRPLDTRMIEHVHHRDTLLAHVCPSPFSADEKYRLEQAAKLAHRALGLEHFSRADMILTPRGVPYLLEVNAYPGLYHGAAFPAMLEAVGSSVGEFAEHAVRLARGSV